MLTWLKKWHAEQLLLVLLVASILWRGGKSIDATWVLSGIAALLTIGSFFYDRLRSSRREAIDTQSLPSWMRGGVIFIIAWTIVSYALSSTRNYGLDEVFRTTSYLLLFLWIVRLRERGMDDYIKKTFPSTLSITAVISAIVGMFVYVLQPVMRFTGTFFDARFHTDYWPNAWAEFLLMAIPLTLLCSLRSPTKRYWWYAALIILLSSLYLSLSRGGMIAFAGEAILLLMVLFVQLSRTQSMRRMMKIHVRGLIASTLIIITLAAALIYSLNAIRSVQFDVQSFSEKVTFTAAEGRSSVDERAQFWDQAIQMFTERPIVGWGPYSFRFVQPQSMQFILATSDHPHNAILKMAAERGLPTAVLFILLIGGILFSSLRSLIEKNSEAFDEKILRMTMLVAVCGVLAHVMIDYNLQFTAIGMSLFILLGLLAPLRPSSDERRASFSRWRIRRSMDNLAACFAVALLVMTVWEGLFLVTSSLGRHAIAEKNTASALTWFSRSHMELFSRDLYLSEASLYLEQQNPIAAEQSLTTYQSLNVEDPRSWKLLGKTYLKNEQFDKAVAALEVAYARGAYTDIGILHLLLQAYSQEGAEAYKSRKTDFDALFVAYADAIEANTHFIALSDNVEELQQVSRLLARLFPADADRYKKIARDAAAHAQKERQDYDARPVGAIW